MPRVLMSSNGGTAASPEGGPPASPPQSSASPPPKASSPPPRSPPPPTPSPPLSPPPAAPANSSAPPPSRDGSPTSQSEQSKPKSANVKAPPPSTFPTLSPPPPASPPPSSPSGKSKPPPPPSPAPSSPPPPLQSSPPLQPPPATPTPTPPSPAASTPPSPPASPPPSPSGNIAAAKATPSIPSGEGTPPSPVQMQTPLPGTPPSLPMPSTQPPPALATPSSFPPPMGATPTSRTPGATLRGSGTATSSALASSPGVPNGVLIGVALAGFFLALASMIVFLCYKNQRKKRSMAVSHYGRKKTLVVPERVLSPDVYHPSNGPSPSVTNSYDFSGSKSWFTYDELVGITGGFTADKVIGEGGFGKVYLGTLGDGRRVAVKQLKVGGGQGEKEFRAEVEIISRIHHRHLVTLVGYCVTENHRLLVYEFVSNQTLEHHLHCKTLPVMDWPKRMKIAIGSGRGLTYLHEDCHPRIIHRDIKSANILLDDAFEAKVADFGLAKLTDDTATHISTRVVGTFGYMAPEYASSGKLTDRSDVFSFGVVLLELITGRKPVDSSQPLGEESLVEWSRPLLVHALDTDDFSQLADPALECRYSKIEMRRMVEAAAACIRHSVAKRPRMVQVWRSLDVDGGSSDLTNGVKLGQSTAYDSNQYSADIELFRRMAFTNDMCSGDYGYLDEDEHHYTSSGEHKSEVMS